MRGRTGRILAVLALSLSGTGVRGDDAEALARQRDAALAAWKQLHEDEAPASEETAHLLILAPGRMTPKQLRDLGQALEARYGLARKALKLDPKETLWPGKLTVYLLGDRRAYNSFLRTIAKQRPSADESGVFSVRGDPAFVAVGPPQAKNEPSMEAQAGEQLASAVLVKKGGEGLPGWVIAGFGRATAWQAAPALHYGERTHVKKLVRGHTAPDIWDDKLSAVEAPLLRASLVDFLAYGPGAASFPKFVDAFKPDAGGRAKTMAQALKAVGYDPDRLNNAWLTWLARGR
jgi:hypothetical protein